MNGTAGMLTDVQQERDIRQGADMTSQADICYRAVVARDARFDGVFFVAVKTTGIYCRPICRARTPGRNRCVFFRTAAEAERSGFRACFRCRPELAPGSAPVDSISRVVATAVRTIDAGGLGDGKVTELARLVGVSPRHLRRAMQVELGITPAELALSRRVALAKQLITDTALPMTEVAFASGFRSVRRFNGAIAERYGRPPSRLRRVAAGDPQSGVITLTLDYRPPYDWAAMLAYLRARAIPGVELVRDEVYARTACLGGHRGWLSVAPAAEGRCALQARLSASLAGAIPSVVARLRRMFDLDAHPAVIGEHLRRDPVLAAAVAARPGLRVIGAFDDFETAMRAVLGQQISVIAARTLAGRVAAKWGEPIATGETGLSCLFPDAERIARADDDELCSIGLPLRRARTLRVLADAMLNGNLHIHAGADPHRTIEALMRLPGIGAWTAHYLAMRVLRWPDAFPAGDLGLRSALGGASERELRAHAERWRPWRAYAATYLWTCSVPLLGNRSVPPAARASAGGGGER